ncbi:MAG TPA: hypothetical protein VHG93_26380 [Longimicrobium sp.]|nr:hypothetical protein [Longimicrobium sp.]
MHSTGGEASIEFKSDAGGVAFHMGSKTLDDGDRFFLWQSDAVGGDRLYISKNAVTVIGALVADSLVINGSTSVTGIQPAASAPPGANLETLLVDVNTGKLYYQ